MSNTGSTMRKGALENVTFEFVLDSPAVSRMSCSSYLECFRNRRLSGWTVAEVCIYINIYIYIYIYSYIGWILWADRQFIHKSFKRKVMYLPNASTTSKIWHKVNFKRSKTSLNSFFFFLTGCQLKLKNPVFLMI